MIVLDVLAMLVGIAGMVLALVAVRLAREARERANSAHRESLDALSHSTGAAELAGRAGADASDSINRSIEAGELASRAQAVAAEAMSRANAAATLAREIDRANSATSLPVAHTDVRWEAEQIRAGRWLIRNVGTSVAAAALMSDASRPPKFITAAEIIPRDVGPGDNLQFKVAGVWDAPPRVRVTWSEPGLPDRQAFELTLVI